MYTEYCPHTQVCSGCLAYACPMLYDSNQCYCCFSFFSACNCVDHNKGFEARKESESSRAVDDISAASTENVKVVSTETTEVNRF